MLAVVVLIKNSRSTTNQLFMCLAVALVGWSITNYLSLNAETGAQTLYWIRWIMFFVVLQNTSFILLVKVFPANHFDFWHRKPYIAIIIYSIITAGVSLSRFLFYDFRDGAPVPGPGMVLFIVHALLFAGAGIELVVRYRRARGLVKAQLAYFLAGTLFMFTVLPIGNFIIPVVFKYNQLVYLSPLYSIVFTGFIAYAIVKKKLFDIRVIIARSVTFVLLLATIAALYTITLFGITATLFGGKSSPVLTGALAIILAFTFQPLRLLIGNITDKFFFKGSYSINDVLEDLGKVLASSLRLEFITRGMLKKLKQVLKFESAGFVMVSGGKVTDIVSDGLDASAFGTSLKFSVLETSGVVVFDDLDEGDLKNVLREKNIAVIIPLKTESGIIGYLAVGSKQSGDTYSRQDIRLLEILAPEAAVAIQNALAYEEIRKFNVRLQEEIEKATGDLRRANEQLKELDKLKDEFVSLASHELRTPMTAIRGSLATILEGYAGEVSPQAREFLTAAYNENDRLIRLVNNLLNISRIEAGRLTFNIETVNMDGIITEVISNLERAAKEKSLFLVYERKGDVPKVRADSDKVREVLINLIGNAIKFTHKGGLTVRTMRKDAVVVTSVTDTGSGIAKTDQDLLFKKFSQVQGSYAKTSGGTGLGLYISKQIVEGLGGKIWLDSTIGIGSTFYFSLPVAEK